MLNYNRSRARIGGSEKSCPERAQKVDSEAENSRLKELYKQALRDIQEKESQLKESKSQIDDLNGALTDKERGITEAEEERRKAQAASLEATKEWEQLRQENPREGVPT